MPLKLSRRHVSAAWQITGTVAGQRVRETSGTHDKALAEQIRAKREAEIHRGQIYGPASVKNWEDAVVAYLEEYPASAGTIRLLARLNAHFGRTLLKDIGQEEVDRVMKKLCPTGTPATKLRNVLVPIRAVMTHASVRKWCDRPIFKAPRGSSGERRTRWLRPEEASALVAAAAPHLRPLIVFMYCTGARIREALGLDWSQVDLPNSRAVFLDVKSRRGEQRDRHADLLPAAVAALSALPHREGRVFRRDDGKPYGTLDREGGGQIKKAWATACRNAGLMGEWTVTEKGNRWWTPLDVTPHVLRHSFASWHYAVHRDIMLLKDVGDWSSVTLVERYTKLVPSGMAPSIKALWSGMPLTSHRHTIAS